MAGILVFWRIEMSELQRNGMPYPLKTPDHSPRTCGTKDPGFNRLEEICSVKISRDST